MPYRRYSLALLLTLWTGTIEAWTLADRLSGGFDLTSFLPHKEHRICAKQRRRRHRQDVSLFAGTEQSPSTKNSYRQMMEFIQQPQESMVGDLELPPKTTPNEDPLADLVRCIAKAADDRKAQDIVALRVKYVSTLTSFVVIVSGNSRPQNQAIAKSITEAVALQFDEMRPGGKGVPEGSAESGWILLDYGSVMVHIMAPKSRLFYNVEGQWRDKGGEEMDLSGILVPNSPPSMFTTATSTAMVVDSAGSWEEDLDDNVDETNDEDEEETDPFWS